MTAVSRDRVEAALKTWTEPHLGTDLVTAQAVRDIVVDGGQVSLALDMGSQTGCLS